MDPTTQLLKKRKELMQQWQSQRMEKNSLNLTLMIKIIASNS